MKAATKTRTQRRMEKKQTLILLVLVLAVSLASFFLGAMVGRQGTEREIAQKQQAAERILVAKAPQREAAPAVAEKKKEELPVAEAEAVEQKPEEAKLTFYEKLAKEEAVPLGSGINLPPQPQEPAKPVAAPPIPLPEQPVVKKQVAETVAKVETALPEKAAEGLAQLPQPDSKGGYAVQVGSFAAAGDAGAFKGRLLAKGYPAFVAEADLGAKGLWYRVKVGPYAEADTAKSVQQLLAEKEKIKGFVSRQ